MKDNKHYWAFTYQRVHDFPVPPCIGVAEADRRCDMRLMLEASLDDGFKSKGDWQGQEPILTILLGVTPISREQFDRLLHVGHVSIHWSSKWSSEAYRMKHVFGYRNWYRRTNGPNPTPLWSYFDVGGKEVADEAVRA